MRPPAAFCGRAVAVAALTCAAMSTAHCTTYQIPVPHPTLQSVAPLLNPGDLVEVQGNATYAGGVVFNEDGTASSPITIRGISVAGNRPRLHGGGDVVKLDGDNYVFEGFEITGATSPLTNRGIFCVANNVTVRDCFVHDCPRHGILGADQFSGNTLIEHVEVARCGSGTQYHQLYMATDNMRFPNAVVRIQHCFVHDAVGGNSIKSRAGRNEIWFNWVEGAMYHELDLHGADLAGQDGSVTENTVHEMSDIVGNVFDKVTTSSGAVARVGGDGSGDSHGWFRFVNNTMLMRGSGSAAVRLQDHVESLEFFNNAVWRPDGSAVNIVRTTELLGTCAHAGANNWVQSPGTGARPEWTSPFIGANPSFTNLALYDLAPTAASPLRNSGALPTSSPSGFPFPSPLASPTFQPLHRVVCAPGLQQPRTSSGIIDIGAYEYAPVSAGISHWEIY